MSLPLADPARKRNRPIRERTGLEEEAGRQFHLAEPYLVPWNHWFSRAERAALSAPSATHSR